MAIESPKYKVIKKDGRFELREYERFITASVVVSSDSFNSAGNQGFGALADFIFGNNTTSGSIAMTAPVSTQKMESEKIAMTVPVDTKSLGPDRYSVSFTMPASYSLTSLPKPNNTDVKIKQFGSHKTAALKFAGYTQEDKILKKITELKKWCRQNKLKTIGGAVVSRFDAPWKPGFLRHNEVSFNVE